MLNKVDPPDELPGPFIQTLQRYGSIHSTLRDAPFQGLPDRVADAQAEAERIITYHKRKLFPFWMT